jgi:hypothetical protein
VEGRFKPRSQKQDLGHPKLVAGDKIRNGQFSHIL